MRTKNPKSKSDDLRRLVEIGNLLESQWLSQKVRKDLEEKRTILRSRVFTKNNQD